MNATLFDTFLSAQRKALDETFKTWKRFLNLPKVPRMATRVRVGSTPHDVVYEEDTLKLLRYCNPDVKFQEPILICYALVNRPYILDLQPSRSVVQQLLKRGFNVYLIDWGVPTAADRTMRLHDYVCGLMKHVGEFVRADSESNVFHLFGYCMGGAMSAMYTSVFPEFVKTLTLLAAPIDFSADEGLLHLWTKEEHFDVDKLINAYGNCPPAMLQGAFGMMKPVQNFIEKYTSCWENLHDEKYLENFFAMEQWTNDNIPVAGETFREFVKCLYQRNQLVKGEFRLRHDVPVKLERITCPLLLLTADFDHLVPPSSTLGIKPHVRSTEIKAMSIAAGHVGLATSSKAHRQLWPEAANWIAEHSAESKDEG
jgi:polyhydroxyalkanoate synthase subunit PhaC